jgi:hypothetical protein
MADRLSRADIARRCRGPLSASIVAGRRAGLVSRGRIIAHLAIPASEGYGLRLDLCSPPSQRSLDDLHHIRRFR